MRTLSRYGRILHQLAREIKRNDPHRNVQEEQPPPTVVICNPTTHRGTDRWSHDYCHSIYGERHTSFFWREGICENRLLTRLQSAASRPLDHAAKHKDAERRRQPAKERSQRKQKYAAHVETLAAKPIGHPSADGKHHGVRHQVRGQHPGALVRARGKVPCNVRQRHVSDGAIERLHESCQRHRDCNQPWIRSRLPSVMKR